MKVIIAVALALVAVAVAVPLEEPKVPQIVRSEFNQDPEGGYHFSYETENGINRNEEGETKVILDEENKPHTVVVVRGLYNYVDKDGKPETVNYYADETGYHADGDSIPKNPTSRR